MRKNSKEGIPIKHTRWIGILLAIALLMTGCSYPDVFGQKEKKGEISRIFSSMQRPDGMTAFPDMRYTRPDDEALTLPLDTATRLAQEGQDADALCDALEKAFAAYNSFYTMQTIAAIRADADVTDAYYSRERDYCESMAAGVEQSIEKMLRACALSELRPALERAGMFAVHELDYYEDSDDYSDELVALYEQESELIAQYRALTTDPEITLSGQTVNLNEYLSDLSITKEEHDAVYLAYLRQVNEAAAEIYCKLVRVRKSLAEANGLGSYEAFQFSTYGRDYQPMEVAMYLADIRDILAPLRGELLERGEYGKISYPDLTEGKLLATLSNAVDSMGEPATEAWRFMSDYRLYDVTVSLKKAATSYTAYLYSYNAPYMFVDTYGDVEDICTVAHEFGHFLAAYGQGNANASLDLDEVYSQAMELMMLNRADDSLDAQSCEALIRLKLLDLLDTYTQQAAITAFEEQVYELPAEALTTDRLNELFYSCMEEFCCTELGQEQTRLWWTQIDHIYSAPFYVMSYAVSVDAAMQIFEKGPEADWTAYRSLLDNPQLPFLRTLGCANLKSPFSEGRIAEAAEVIRARLAA